MTDSPDFWLLIEFDEGYANTSGPIYTWTIEDDYYKPIMATKTRQELVAFLEDGSKAGEITWDGNIATVPRYSWRGEHKGTDIYCLFPVKFGELIEYR